MNCAPSEVQDKYMIATTNDRSLKLFAYELCLIVILPIQITYMLYRASIRALIAFYDVIAEDTSDYIHLMFHNRRI